MNETNMNVVLDALAETIKRLREDVLILRYENERLREELKTNERKDSHG